MLFLRREDTVSRLKSIKPGLSKPGNNYLTILTIYINKSYLFSLFTVICLNSHVYNIYHDTQNVLYRVFFISPPTLWFHLAEDMWRLLPLVKLAKYPWMLCSVTDHSCCWKKTFRNYLLTLTRWIITHAVVFPSFLKCIWIK